MPKKHVRHGLIKIHAARKSKGRKAKKLAEELYPEFPYS